MEWFKLYHEARLDKKLSLLTLAERGVWINLLCYASEQTERGAFDASDRFSLALECAEGDEAILNSTIEKLLKVKHLITTVTSETSRNERNGLVTDSVTSQWLTFRTFASRQAQKASNFPSDAPERVTARVRKHRASRKSEGDVTSETSRNDTEEDVDEEEEEEEERELEGEYSPSGKHSSLSDDDAERVNAPAASAASVSQQWTRGELQQVGRRIIGRMKLPASALDGLMLILQQYPHAPPWLESEASLCAEWCATKHKKPSLSIFNRWLKRDTQQQLQQTMPAAQSTNGHTPGTEVSSNGTIGQQRGASQPYDPSTDEAFQARRRKGAELVRELAERETS